MSEFTLFVKIVHHSLKIRKRANRIVLHLKISDYEYFVLIKSSHIKLKIIIIIIIIDKINKLLQSIDTSYIQLVLLKSLG